METRGHDLTDFLMRQLFLITCDQIRSKILDQLSRARQMLRNFLASGHHRLRHLLCDKRLKKHFKLKPKGRGQASDDAKVCIKSAKRSSLVLVSK